MNRRDFFKSTSALLAAFALPKLAVGAAYPVASEAAIEPFGKLAADLSGANEPKTVAELMAWFERTFNVMAIVPDIGQVAAWDPDLLRWPVLPYSAIARRPVTWKIGVILTDEFLEDAGGPYDLNKAIEGCEAALCQATFRFFSAQCVGHPEIVGGPLYWRRPFEFYEPEVHPAYIESAERHYLLRGRLLIPGLELTSKEGLPPDWASAEHGTGTMPEIIANVNSGNLETADIHASGATEANAFGRVCDRVGIKGSQS